MAKLQLVVNNGHLIDFNVLVILVLAIELTMDISQLILASHIAVISYISPCASNILLLPM